MKKAWRSIVLGTIVSTAHSSTIGNCLRYSASHVKHSFNGLAAGLTLIGSTCKIYDSRLHVKIYDANRQVYQIPESVLPPPPNDEDNPSQASLKFAYTARPFSFAVSRLNSGDVLFNTSGSQLIFESQYVRLRTRLRQNPNLYGLGEHTDTFRLQTNNHVRTFWNAESPFVPRMSHLYGSHPIYLEHRDSGHSHGVFLRNSNGMNIVINQTEESGSQYLEYNTIGGVLDLYYLAGPSPTEVSKQNAEVVGQPAMVPYWSFGFMQCKYGYWDVNELAEVVGNYSTAGIPLDVLWSDIDYMDLRQDFTTDSDRFSIPKMRELFVMMVDPGIHRKGDYGPIIHDSEMEIFLKAADGSYYRGVQWAGEVVWPDWFNPNTQDWWNNHRGPMKGLPGRNLFTLPYRINNHVGNLSSSTVYTNITNYDGTVQYDTHNLNGFMMAAHSRVSMLARRPGKRPFVLTRPTFASAGNKVAHWFGDNYSAWDDYRFSISQMLAFAAVHQMPMVGSDVCGFNGNAQENICARWALLGAFQPFYRNHADISAPNQEFFLWASVTEAAKKAIAARYRLPDYIYTVMHRSRATGTPIVNPLFFKYPSDNSPFGIQTHVTIYLPNEIFYDFWTFKPGRIYIRRGSIIPMHTDGANSTTALRQHNFSIVVAPDLDGKAAGFLVLDDGESLEGGASDVGFSWDGKEFMVNGQFWYQTAVSI
ncbi:glycosyl hydrolases family 31 domain-containing protein [Trichoderma austrokoningii]